MSIRTCRATNRIGAALGATVLAVGLAACNTGSADEEGESSSEEGESADEEGESSNEGDAASGEGATITIYSGRDEELVGPLFEQMEEATDLTIEARYGDSAELAAQILEEGEGSPADVYFSQDAGSLGALSEADVLAELPGDLLSVAPEAYQAADGTWVATSARSRVVAYNSEMVSEDELPQSLDDLLEPQWEGQIGYPPTNGSWQAFVTGLRVTLGEDGARDWLTAFAETDPVRFEDNSSTLEAVNSGQIQLGLINHYYLYGLIDEIGEDEVVARNHYVPGDDPLALVNVAGAGTLVSSEEPEAAQAAVEFLLSEEAQQYFADETAEYAVREDVESTEHDLPPISSLAGPDIDLTQLSSLEETLTLLQETGVA